MKKIIITLSLLNVLAVSQLSAMKLKPALKKPQQASQEQHQISKETFEICKNNLPGHLKCFVTNFATWPKEDKDKIQILGLGFTISGLDKERTASYDSNVGYWIDCRTQTQAQRVNFITCLKHLQQ